MIMLDDFESLKREVEEAQRKKDQAEGALAQLMKSVKKEFGCNSLQELQDLLDELKEQERQIARKVESKTEEFRKRFHESLNKKEDHAADS